MIINSNNALPAQKLQNCAVAAIKLLFLTRLAPLLRLCTRRLGNGKIKNKLLILHFARLAVILDKSRGVSAMQNQKASSLDFAFRSTCSNFE
ncbi:MAG: hypothetical protein MRZ38_05955 [Muribaculaceae bacterium]|nr:hypothetical protein [Muribaculaceae bacterium]